MPATPEDPDVNAVLAFMRNDPLGQVQPGDGFDPSGIISFQVDGRIVIDNPAVQAFWETTNSDPDAPVMQCLVCGNQRPVLGRLQAKVKGIPGGQPAGTSLISANAAAFESYGLTESLTSPICSNCAEGFSRGINALLADNRSRFASGDSVSVFWTSEEQEFDYFAMMETPDPIQVRALMESVRTGRPVEVNENSFYAISLTASGGRATVRDWMDTTVERVEANLAEWFRGQRIAPGFDGETRYYGLRALAFATVREPRDLPRTTPRTLVRAAFAGTPLPMDLMAQAVRRNRAEQRITRPRAALIKLVMLSHEGEREEEYMVELDSNNPDPAYLCGRLMAVFEEAQREAIRRNKRHGGGPFLRYRIGGSPVGLSHDVEGNTIPPLQAQERQSRSSLRHRGADGRHPFQIGLQERVSQVPQPAATGNIRLGLLPPESPRP